jgi:hypothetical protein
MGKLWSFDCIVAFSILQLHHQNQQKTQDPIFNSIFTFHFPSNQTKDENESFYVTKISKKKGVTN